MATTEPDVEVAGDLLAQVTATTPPGELGALSDVQATRAKVLLPMLLIVAAALGFSGLVPWLPDATPPMPAATPPVATFVGEDDGLPADLVVGRRYQAHYRLGYPADWPTDTRDGRTQTYAEVYVYIRPDGRMDTLIAASDHNDDVAGKIVTWTCDIGFSVSEIGGVTLFVTSGTSVFFGGGTTKAFRHTVVAAPG